MSNVTISITADADDQIKVSALRAFLDAIEAAATRAPNADYIDVKRDGLEYTND